MSFSELGLTEDVLKAVSDAGYTEPTPIQKQAIPIVLMGRDILGCAQTGTGKTASFTLPMIDILASGRAKARMPRTLILEPTRELAAQVAENFETYGKYNKLSMALLIGGVSMEEQKAKLDRGVDVLIATPGRLLDLFDRGGLLLNDAKMLVIDEADRMLDMGFIPDVEKIVSLLPKIRQTLFFSATMPPAIRKLADMFLMNPKEITVAAQSSAAKTVVQGLYKLKGGGMGGQLQWRKRTVLRKLLRDDALKNAIVFCNRKRDVGIVHRSLERHGFNAGQLHGDMVQSSRMETLDLFKNGDIDILVCSDVAARGIDIKAMSHVFNYDVPTHSEDYVHRIGRTGRAGLEGHAFTIATDDDAKYLAGISRLIGKDIPELNLEDLMGDEYAEVAKIEEGGRPSGDRGGRERGGRGGRDRGGRGGRDRNRGGRGNREERPNNPTASSPTSETSTDSPNSNERPTAAAEETPAVEEKAPESKHSEARPNGNRTRDNNRRPQREPRDNSRRRRNGRGFEDDGPDIQVKGFGTAIPAFLLKGVELSADSDDGEEETQQAEPRAPRKRAPRKKAEVVETNAVEAAGEGEAPVEATPAAEVQVIEIVETTVAAAPAAEEPKLPEPDAESDAEPEAEAKPKAKRTRTTRAKTTTTRKPRKTKAQKEAEAKAAEVGAAETGAGEEAEKLEKPKAKAKAKAKAPAKPRKPRKTKAQKEAEAKTAEEAAAAEANDGGAAKVKDEGDAQAAGEIVGVADHTEPSAATAEE